MQLQRTPSPSGEQGAVPSPDGRVLYLAQAKPNVLLDDAEDGFIHQYSRAGNLLGTMRIDLIGHLTVFAVRPDGKTLLLPAETVGANGGVVSREVVEVEFRAGTRLARRDIKTYVAKLSGGYQQPSVTGDVVVSRVSLGGRYTVEMRNLGEVDMNTGGVLERYVLPTSLTKEVHQAFVAHGRKFWIGTGPIIGASTGKSTDRIRIHEFDFDKPGKVTTTTHNGIGLLDGEPADLNHELGGLYYLEGQLWASVKVGTGSKRVVRTVPVKKEAPVGVAPPLLRAVYPAVKKKYPRMKEGGIVGDAAHGGGYHVSAADLKKRDRGSDYSLRSPNDQRGADQQPNWCAAIDLTFPVMADQIAVSKTLMAACTSDTYDPRIEPIREWFGTTNGKSVTGYNRYDAPGIADRAVGVVSSDPTHLWHVHISVFRDDLDDPDKMLGLIEIITGVPMSSSKTKMLAPAKPTTPSKPDTGTKPTTPTAPVVTPPATPVFTPAVINLSEDEMADLFKTDDAVENVGLTGNDKNPGISFGTWCKFMWIRLRDGVARNDKANAEIKAELAAIRKLLEAKS